MLLEALGKPLKYRLRSGEELLLRPGIPVEMPDDSARALMAKAGDRVRVVRPSIQAGSLVTWQRGDGSSQEGFVDFLHTDPDGQQWAFLSFGETWAAVNRKLLTVATA